MTMNPTMTTLSRDNDSDDDDQKKQRDHECSTQIINIIYHFGLRNPSAKISL